MKTKDLIKLLQEADPSGETECVIFGQDIFYVDNLPGYYDGSYEVLIRDPNKAGYDIIGCRLTTKANKIVIKTFSCEDVIYENPNAKIEIDYDYLNPKHAEDAAKWVEKTRIEARKMKDETKKWFREAILEKAFQKFLTSPNVETLQKEFGGWVGRSDVYEFLKEKANNDLILQKWLEERWKL